EDEREAARDDEVEGRLRDGVEERREEGRRVAVRRAVRQEEDPEQPERDRRERHATTEIASIGECDRHWGADATAPVPRGANAFRRTEQQAGRRAGGRDILPPCPPRASCVSTRSSPSCSPPASMRARSSATPRCSTWSSSSPARSSPSTPIRTSRWASS